MNSANRPRALLDQGGGWGSHGRPKQCPIHLSSPPPQICTPLKLGALVFQKLELVLQPRNVVVGLVLTVLSDGQRAAGGCTGAVVRRGNACTADADLRARTRGGWSARAGGLTMCGGGGGACRVSCVPSFYRLACDGATTH